MQRMGMVIGIKPEKIAEYKELHANCWPEILKGIEESNIRNYSIWLHEGEQRLFSYWEYHGDDFAADMQKMADDPITKKWWAVCKPCQNPLETRKEGEHWSMMEEVFYHDKK